MKWDVWNSAEYDPTAVRACAKEAGCSLLLAATLRARGISSKDEIAHFLAADRTSLHDPLLMADMDTGAARIKQAIAAGERVAVYGDYDVDGITASVLMADYLKSRGLSCSVYIPDRLGEGYGLSLAALEGLAKDGVTLVITVDCGVSAIEETAYAKTLGIDMVITDHHQCPGELPAALAIIDPKRPDCPYPNKDLSGVGVAFKCICAIAGDAQLDALLDRYADLVAIGTVADVMNLTGENRVFVAEGLSLLRCGERAGLRALMQEAGIDASSIGVVGIGYSLAPRLNAAGRMGNAALAFSLVDTTDIRTAESLAAELCDLNQKRQEIEAEILEDALQMLELECYTAGPIVLASETWHKGVLGIVASRLMERYHEPVILLCIESGVGRGSCRSVDGFDVFSALQATSGFLDTHGGHEQAAGLTISAAQFQAFKDAFLVYYKENPPKTEGGVLEADFTVSGPDVLSLDQVKSLERLEPCGRGNPSPMLIIEEAALVKVQSIGGGKHVKMQVEKWGMVFDCVYFSMTTADLGAKVGDYVDLAFTPQCNTFRGKTTVQFLIRDIGRTRTRRLGKARRLCTRLFAGEDPSIHASDAVTLCPERANFVALWRQLELEPVRAGQTESMLSSLIPAEPARAYICLRVFDELGLADVQDEGGLLHITRAADAQKVDLNASRIFKSLQRGCGNG